MDLSLSSSQIQLTFITYVRRGITLLTNLPPHEYTAKNADNCSFKIQLLLKENNKKTKTTTKKQVDLFFY